MAASSRATAEAVFGTRSAWHCGDLCSCAAGMACLSVATALLANCRAHGMGEDGDGCRCPDGFSRSRAFCPFPSGSGDCLGAGGAQLRPPAWCSTAPAAAAFGEPGRARLQWRSASALECSATSSESRTGAGLELRAPYESMMRLYHCMRPAQVDATYRLFSTSSHGVFSQVESSDGCQQTALTVKVTEC